MSAVEFDGVTKSYGSKIVLDNVCFSVEPGERVAILGPNGAGKSTLLRIALGLAPPTRGTCRLYGRAPGDRLGWVGYSPQANTVPDHLRVGEIIRFVCDTKAAPRPEDLIDRLALRPLLGHTARDLSLGQRRRLTLLLALVGRPRLALLDEPTTSMDADGRNAAWQVIQEFCDDGGTVLLATHDFSEVARLAHRALVFIAGQLRVDSTASGIARNAGISALELPHTTDLPLADVAYVIHRSDRTVVLTRRPEAVIGRIGDLNGAPVVRRRPTLEEVCLVLAGGRSA